MAAPPYVLAATATGPSHVRAGRSTQDAFAHRPLADGVACAVADGLGSAPWGGLGAVAAVDAAVAACVAGAGVASALIAARVAVEAAAASVAAPVRDFACTLLVGVASAGELQVAHIGDGAAVLACGGSLRVLSAPADSEYVDEVVPLTSERWEASARISAAPAPDALALFTDGCQRAALRRAPEWTAHEGWWAPIFAFARRVTDPEAGSAEIARLLAGPRLSEHSDDDKTLLVAVL